MLKQFEQITVRTEHSHPLTSPDYLNPAGCIEDNHTNTQFIWEIDSFFEGQPYKLLDIGCAGGQFAVDIYNKGTPWVGVGLEGGNIFGMTESFEERETCTGPITTARGTENWKRYKDKCLFYADVSKPFEILDKDGELVKFDIITAYEFFEHPKPEEIPHIIQNIKKHSKCSGATLVVGTINLSSGCHHRCAKPVEWWNEIFIKHGFGVYEYPFKTSPRSNRILESNERQIEKYSQEFVNQGGDLRHLGEALREKKLKIKVQDQEVAPTEFNYPACFVLEN